MSTFYLLPARAYLGQCLARSLESVLPGLSWDRARWPALADDLLSAVGDRTDVYLVPREELPADEDARQALTDGYGAAPGDEVVELRAGARPGELAVTRWQV